MVAQRFMPSSFDWRVITLGGRAMAVCKYIIPEKSFKIIAMIDGKLTWNPVEAMPVGEADPRLLDTALRAGAAVGQGFYGIDIKQHGDVFTVIEVNDNPTLNAGEEDRHCPEIYEAIVRLLLEERRPNRPVIPSPRSPEPGIAKCKVQNANGKMNSGDGPTRRRISRIPHFAFCILHFAFCNPNCGCGRDSSPRRKARPANLDRLVESKTRTSPATGSRRRSSAG